MDFIRVENCDTGEFEYIEYGGTLLDIDKVYIFNELDGCWKQPLLWDEPPTSIIATVKAVLSDCETCADALINRYQFQNCDTLEIFDFRVSENLVLNNVYRFLETGNDCFKLIESHSDLTAPMRTVLGTFDSCIDCLDAPDLNTIIIEDDINIKLSREMTINEPLFFVQNDVVISNGTDTHTLFSYTIPLTQNYSSGYLVTNEQLAMPWAPYFPINAVNNYATVVANKRNLKIKLPNLINWRYFQSLQSLITVFGADATNNWLWYQNNGWQVKVLVKLNNGVGNYIDEVPLNIRDYDDNPSIDWSWEVFRKSDLTALTSPIAGEKSIFKITADMPTNSTIDIDYSTVTVEAYEGNERWVISSVYSQLGQANSPLQPMDTYNVLRQTNVTSPNRKAELEFVFDPSKINATKIRFTARVYRNGENLFTERTERVYSIPSLPTETKPREQSSDECCDCPPELKLASSTSEELMENDITGVVYRKSIDTDTCVFKIFKDGVELPNGGVDYNNGFPYDANVIAFIYNWKYYLINYGQGCYKIESHYTVAGVSFVKIEGIYKLEEFTEDNARGTARVLYQNNFETLWEDSTINYADSGFEDSYRFRGMLHDWQPNVFSDSNFSEFNENRVSSIKSKDTYKLSLFNANECHVQRLHKIVMHAALWRVSDHNPSNALQENKIYECVLDKENTEQITYFNGSRIAGVEVILSKRQQNSVSLFNGSVQLVKGITWQLPTVNGSGGSCSAAIITNSNGTFNDTVDGGDTLVLADVNNVDSDGTIVPTPAMIPFVCTPELEAFNSFLEKVGTVESVCIDNDFSVVDVECFDASPLTSVTDWQPSDVNTTDKLSSDGTGGVLVSASNLKPTSISLLLPYMVVIGDSIARGSMSLGGRLQTIGATSLYEPTLVSEAGQINYELSKLWNIPALNQGIGGHSTTQVRARWNRDVLAIPTAVGDGRPNTTLDFGGQKPRLVFLHCGINDSFYSIAPSVTKSNLEFFASSCLANNIQLVMSNIGAYSGLSPGREAAIVEVNNWIESDLKVNHPEVTVIDYLGWSTDFTYDYNNLKAGMFGDAVHPNKTGYASFSQYIFENCNPNIKLSKLNLGYYLDSSSPYPNFSRITNFVFNETYYNISNTDSDSVELLGLTIVDTPVYEMLITAVEIVTNSGILEQSTGLSSVSCDVVDAGSCNEYKNVILIGNSEITNSDRSVTLLLSAEGKLILPDIRFTDSDGTTRLIPAFTDVIAKQCEVTGIDKENLDLFFSGWDSASYSGSGTTWEDLTTPQTNASIVSATFDPIKKAFSMNGTTDYMTIDSSFVIDSSNPWTLTAICAPEDTAELFPTLCSLKLSTGGTLSLNVKSSGSVGLRIMANPNIWRTTSLAPFLPGEPLVIVLKFLGGVKTDIDNWELKINEVDSKHTFDYPITPVATNNFIGGLSSGNKNFKGEIYGLYHRVGASTDIEDSNNYSFLKTIIPGLP